MSHNGGVSEPPRSAARRTARLAALPLSYAGRTALGLGRRLGGASAEAVMTEVQLRTAEQIFRTLGELKGGAMKVGQAMSIFEAALPEEMAAPYREQLTRLQDSAPPMPTQTVRETIEANLGPGWREDLVELEGDPAAAASIGQVHKGRWRDGREVAVKVQYPGAAEAFRSDLKQLERLSKAIGPALPGIDIRALIAEVRARAVEELDYQLEAESQRAFAAAYRDHPTIVVPDVVADGETMLITEWIDSSGSLAQVISGGTEAERQHYGRLAVEFWLGCPGVAGMLHADPHPGNFRTLPAPNGTPGRLAVLDFGAVARLPERAIPRQLGRLVWIATTAPEEDLVAELREIGMIRPNIEVDPVELGSYLGPLIEPASVDEFTFSRRWMQSQFRRMQDPKAEGFSVAFRLNLPPEFMLIHRTWVGAIGVLSQLEVTLPFREMLAEHVPGFGPE